MDSLFSFIKSYIPSSTRDPQEDYLTQLFAYMLSIVPDLGTMYCQFLLEKVKEPKFQVSAGDVVGVKTQVVVQRGRVDLLLTTGGHGFICEHKVASNLGNEQMSRYAESFVSHPGNFYTVLVTANIFQHKQDADIRLTWADISDFLISMQEHYHNEHGYLLKQLIEYMEQQGLARMEPLRMEDILGFSPGQKLPMKLETLLPQLQFMAQLQSMDWKTQCPGLQSLNPEKCQPTFKKFRWGRIGVELFNDMTPGLFVGVMLDYNQIPSLEIYDRQLGPDVVIMLEYDFYPVPKDDNQRAIFQQRSSLFANNKYKTLCSNLRASAQNEGYHYSNELPKSRWRINVLQKPLATVLCGASNEKEQLDRLFETMCQGINLLTQHGLLALALNDVRAESQAISAE